MGTYITEDFTVGEGEDLTFALNTDNRRAAAFIVGDYDAIVGQRYFEPSIINHGRITLVLGDGLISGSLFLFPSSISFDDAIFANYGTMRAILPDAQAIHLVSSHGQIPVMINEGRMIVRAGDVEVFRVSGPIDLYNGPSALISADGNGYSRGFYLHSGGTIVNDGTITAHVRGGTLHPDGEGSTAIYTRLALELNNSGLIEATGANADHLTHAVSVAMEVPLNIVNSGTMRAGHVVYVYDSGNLPQDTVSLIENSGLMDGDIRLVSGHDTIINTGQLLGNVSLGGGDDLFDSSGGEFVGSIDAGDGVDRIIAGAGSHAIEGGDNVDTVVMTGNRGDYTIVQSSSGVFEVTGADGTDTLTGVEYIEFDNTTYRLRPGPGVEVDFASGDPSAYQDAMRAIRDFDGNNLGGHGAWLWIGSADINGDGDIDHILVNDDIGRFATVGTASNGKFYFQDYSWAGETRVAGIYVDPLVHSGDVEYGSDEDSQRRFQNDLEIENINRVLGAGDYDGDGLQEVYFALTDGTAYLHAYMHADGNIRYANYQSEQQVIEFLSANGYDESTWADWFSASQELPVADKAVAHTTLARPEFAAVSEFDPWEAAHFVAEHVELGMFQPVETFA